MVALELDVHADIALFAMKVIPAKPLSNPADTAVIAMVYVFLGVVIPQLANITIVVG